MLVNTAIVNLLITANFILIGPLGSAVCLYMVAVAQSIVSLHHTRRETEITTTEGIVFSVLYVDFGLFGMVSATGFVWEVRWKNLLELLPIVGSLLCMAFVFARNEQQARRFLLASTSVWADGVDGVHVFLCTGGLLLYHQLCHVQVPHGGKYSAAELKK